MIYFDRKENINVILVRNLCTITDVFALMGEMSQLGAARCVAFDFTELRAIKTVATALFARELRKLVSERDAAGFRTVCRKLHDCQSAAIRYLAFIGFFDFIGLHNYGMKVRYEAEKDECEEYIAITSYDYRRFTSHLEVDFARTTYDYIRVEAGKVAKLLSSRGAANDILEYAICEIMRNAFEHSRAEKFFVMGQRWRAGDVELVIMDEGVGLFQSLHKKYPQLSDEQTAIMEAMKPGVSGQDFSKNKYGNSGFGLYVLSEFARRHGQFFIASNDCMVQCSKMSVTPFRVSSAGTFVGIHLAGIPVDGKQELRQIISEGEKVSLTGQYPIGPSKQTLNI